MDIGRSAGPVVAGVDGSEEARAAVRWAAGEAARRGAPLRLVAALVVPQPRHLGSPPGLGTSYKRAMAEAAEAMLAQAAADARRARPDVVVGTELRPGFPEPVLLDESERARLVVVGSRGLGGFTGLLAGSVAVGLAARGACPVVVVRGESEPADPADLRPVVVGVDGSPVSEDALAAAFDAAALRKVPLVALHTWLDEVTPVELIPMISWAEVEAEEHALLAERLAGWAAKYPDVEVRRIVARELPARALVEWSRDAQLVVVGSRGRGGLRGLLLGSVSQALVQHAGCPVLVVRPADSAD